VDGLQAAGYAVHLANTAAIQQYAGLKYSDDGHDARWLAHLLRLGLLPEGYIYPKETRAVRDLLRKRSQLVRQRTRQVLSIENLVVRNTGRSLSGHEVKRLTLEAVPQWLPDPRLALAVASSLVVVQTLDDLIGLLEKQVLEAVRLEPAFQPLLSIPGVGRMLALTIMLETGDIRRFPGVGNFASYCRCVGSEHLSNGKRKGQGNTKNGNKYLAWAFIEAANFAVRYAPDVKRFYQRKRARTNGMVAIKAVAHKLARACYYVLRDQVPFVMAKAFA
jgi:transposase